MKIRKIRLPVSLLKALSGRFFKYQIHSNHKTILVLLKCSCPD